MILNTPALMTTYEVLVILATFGAHNEIVQTLPLLCILRIWGAFSQS